ncbi:hypothetical protein [Thermomonospora cellulosilytica]|uniref:Uncharacterized protein n=1 Tax=Thermomonospora cellulosilytica TaxID=1411118 RepID=A0A7W3N5S1_9ACTN|nr:hypothetical protein [Thermomonospora cellulosilytica]MBA9008035.1 hypothetical protein [Thermomonospora cellulosilytica]
MALGDQIGQETGQITGTRVLPAEDGRMRVEVTFESRGRLLDQDVTEVGTYVAGSGPDGVLRGEGHGVVTTAEGEYATWKGDGVGRLTGQGSATSFRGAIYYRTASQRLARLNGVAAVYEYDTDDSGKTEARTYEWK